MTMQSISHWGLFPTNGAHGQQDCESQSDAIRPADMPILRAPFIEGFHHAVTINQAHERYRKLEMGIRASMPDVPEWHIQHIMDAIAAALESPKVKEALNHLQRSDIIASVAEGVDICV